MVKTWIVGSNSNITQKYCDALHAGSYKKGRLEGNGRACVKEANAG